MFYSWGTLIYSFNPLKLIVEVDQGISDYYRSLIPKYLKVNKQAYPAHISVVRKELPPRMGYWEEFQGEEIDFEYDRWIYNDEKYYWLNVYSAQLEMIRAELGLPGTSEITKSPDGRHKFHFTIGNTK